MSSTEELKSIPDDELLRRLSELLNQSRRVESQLVTYIAEVDERRLYAGRACSSMFTFCTEVLHLSEAEAYLRIAAARASRKYPMLLAMLSDGRIHLSGIGKLAPYLTEANCAEVLARAAHKSKRHIEELVAELSPKPDVPASVRKVPARAEATPVLQVQLRPDAVKNEMPPQPPPPRPATPVVQPLAPARYRVTFTASAELREKLERLQGLMQQELATVIEAAVTEKLERLEAKRFGETKKPRKDLEETDTSGSSRYIQAAVRRMVRKRDGDRCTFVDRDGRRCTERRGLEFHHDDPYGRGGDRSPSNVRLLCKVHNAYLAERDYGKEKMDQYRRNGDRVSEPVQIYGSCSPTTMGDRASREDVVSRSRLQALGEVDPMSDLTYTHHEAERQAACLAKSRGQNTAVFEGGAARSRLSPSPFAARGAARVAALSTHDTDWEEMPRAAHSG